MQRKNETPRLEVRRACGNTLTTSRFNCLPEDVMVKAVNRLGWVSLFYALSLQLVHWGREYTVPGRLIYPDGRTLLYVGLFGGTIMALIIAALSWSSAAPISTHAPTFTRWAASLIGC